MAVGRPLDGVAAEVLLLVQRGLSGHVPEFEGSLHLALEVRREEQGYAKTCNQQVVTHGGVDETVTGLVADGVYR